MSTRMSKKDRIAYVRAGLKSYERLNERSKQITSKTDWIALKLGCSTGSAERYIAEAEADTTEDK